MIEQKTPHTLTTAEALLAELEATRLRGYGIDDEENELGINCVAVPVYLEGSAVPSGAVSVSAVRFRCPVETLVEGVPEAEARATLLAVWDPAAEPQWAALIEQARAEYASR